MKKAPRGCLDGASCQSATIENAVSGHSCVGFGSRSEPDARRAQPASANALPSTSLPTQLDFLFV